MRQLEVTVARGIGFVVLVHFANHLRTSYNALEFLRAKDAQVSLGTFEKSLLLSQTIGEVRNTTKQPPAIMLLNKYGLNMTLNFLCNIAGYRNVLDRIIIFAFDRHSFQVLQRVWPQVRTLYWPVPALEPKFGTGQGAYQLFQLFRANLCTYLSMRGVDHWMIQSDTYWRANFFDLLEGTVGLLAAMIAGGNFFVRGNRQTANFFSRVSRQLKWLYSTDNNIMGSLCAMEFSGNRCAFLPYRLISNWRWHDGPKTDLPVLLQFDGGSGSQTKMEKMQSLGAGFAVFGSNSTVTCDQQKMLNPETMGTAISSASSPEPEDITSTAERLLQILAQKPLRMAQMLRLTRLINDCSPEEKRQLYSAGVVNRILDMIAELGQIGRSESTATGSPAATIGEEKRRRPFIRRNSTLNAAAAAAAATNRGIGYGHGSTRSRWDIERTLEERLVREEHLIWLLNAITAYIFCANPDFAEIDWPKIALRDNQHLDGKIAMDIGESAIVALLEYHLKNDSVFDVSEHMELYQALLETASAMSLLPAFVPYLVRPYATDARSIAKELVPKFRDTMAQYPNTLKGQMGSPDFRLIDFINRIGHYADVIMSAARNYERDLPAEQRIRTAVAYRPRTTRSEATLARSMNDLREFSTSDDRSEPPDAGLLYTKALKHYQMQTARFIGDYGKLVVPFTFKKEVRNVNPFSPALKERTKRVAKELASMPNSLPLQTSNAIFVCVDEGRCDIMKVLISGPDDTPYQNGLFEFDVFFPTSYPFSPPKCAFLTTGSGNIRFNPNLYNDGKICLSILGTWEGRPEEKWNPYCSLLQVLISIQGLIFVKEPYFNEPGFEKHQGTDKGKEFSRKYNLQIQHATLTYAIREQIRSGPDYFKPVILRHFWLKRTAIIEQAQGWLAEVKRDTIAAAAAEKQNNKSHKETSSLTFEGACNPYAQERFIHQLIDELTNMTCPCDYYI